jgi:hypothetical protein
MPTKTNKGNVPGGRGKGPSGKAQPKMMSKPMPASGNRNPGANGATGKLTGGGEGSAKHIKGRTHVPGSSASNKVNPGGVSYLGNKMGNHATDSPKSDFTLKATPLVDGKMKNLGGEYGNTKALEGAGSGARPGGGNRMIYPNGTQGQQGPANSGSPDPGAKRPIFPGFK